MAAAVSASSGAKTLPPLLKGGAAAAAEGFGSCSTYSLWPFFGFSLLLCVNRASYPPSTLFTPVENYTV